MTRRTGRAPKPITSRLMAAAGQEAERARHGYIGCEHLLLALLADKDPTARDILAEHKITLPAARAAVADVISSGRGDGPRCNAADLLATLGIDLPAIQRQMRADYGPHAIDELYRSPVGRRLPWGPLCGPHMAPGLKKALFAEQSRAGFRSSGHALLSLLDVGSSGLGAVLAALGSSTDRLRLTATERLHPTPKRGSPRSTHRRGPRLVEAADSASEVHEPGGWGADAGLLIRRAEGDDERAGAWLPLPAMPDSGDGGKHDPPCPSERVGRAMNQLAALHLRKL